MLVTLVVPSVIIIVLMAAITCSLISSLKRQTRLSGGPSGSRTLTGGATSRPASRSNSSPQAKVTRMLFAVSFFFILLNGPSHIIRMKMAVLDLLGRELVYTPSVEEKLQVIFQIMYYSSFAVNLVIYLIFGDNFRKQFRETYLAPCLRLCGKTRQNGRGCGACSEMTAMSTVRMEEVEARPEEQAVLLDVSAPPRRLNDTPAPIHESGSYSELKEANGHSIGPQGNGHKDHQAYIYGNEVYQGEEYSGLSSSNV